MMKEYNYSKRYFEIAANHGCHEDQCKQIIFVQCYIKKNMYEYTKHINSILCRVPCASFSSVH